MEHIDATITFSHRSTKINHYEVISHKNESLIKINHYEELIQNWPIRSINSNNFYGRERIGESNYHDSQGEFWPKLKQCLTDWTKEALPQSFRTRAF